MRAWVNVAHLTKTKGLDGRFVARAAAGLPFLLEPGDEVAFVPPQLDVVRRAVVEEVLPIDDRTAEVAFCGVDGDAAHVLVGTHCLIARAGIDESVIEEAPGAWDGWSVVDERAGKVGLVSSLVENPGQSLLVVARDDGATVLVPVVDDIVTGVDVDARVVRVDLPKGLLDL